MNAEFLWVDTAGEWLFPEYIPPFDVTTLPPKAIYHPFELWAGWDKPTCVRYSDPYLLKDGRIIQGVVKEEGTPGEPGWRWIFYVTEYVEGAIEVHIRTTDCKVS